MRRILQPLQRAAIPSIASDVLRAHHALMLLLAAMLTTALPAAAQVAVTDAWVRSTVPTQKSTGAFMQLKSPTDAALVAVTSPIAKVAEIHEMKLEGDVMRMRAVDKVALPAGKSVELKPGGYHVMLMELTAPLKAGETVPLTLTFENKGGKQTLEVKAKVKALTSADPPAHKH